MILKSPQFSRSRPELVSLCSENLHIIAEKVNAEARAIVESAVAGSVFFTINTDNSESVDPDTKHYKPYPVNWQTVNTANNEAAADAIWGSKQNF